MIKESKCLTVLSIVFLLLSFSQSLFARMDWYDESASNAEDNQKYSNYKTALGNDKLVTSPTEEYQRLQILPSSSSYSAGSKSILVIINSSVYGTLSANNYTGGTILADAPTNLLERYFFHLKREYGIIVCTYGGKIDIDLDPFNIAKSPADQLRDEIVTMYGQPSVYGTIVGSIFIGELPVKWCKFEETIGPGNDVWLEFPSDLFFMDMNATWTKDPDSGVIISHTDEIEPELWVGRIAPGRIDPMNESALINAYLNKNIKYRETTDTSIKKSYVFDGSNNISVDATGSNSWINILKTIYEDSANVELKLNGSSANTPTEYLTAIRDSLKKYELVHFGVTSSAFNHTFDKLSTYDYINNLTIKNSAEQLFPRYYTIQGAGAARFTSSQYIGGCYIFSSKSEGLALVGSTKSLGMANATEFYTTLQYRCFGESLWTWMNKTLEEDKNDFPLCDGMTIIGDPTLKLYDSQAKAIQSGLEYLGKSPSKVRDGKGEITGEEIASDFRPAIVSLSALAYLNWGMTDNNIVTNAISKITTSYASGGWLVDAGDYAYMSARTDGKELSHGVYNTASAILPLVALSSLTASQRTILEKMRNYLIRCQTPDKGFGYKLDSRSDNSNTQFALMGIYMADYKLNMDVNGNSFISPNIQTNVFDTCIKNWLTKTKAQVGSKGANGGHLYALDGDYPETTVECANAAWSALLCNPQIQDPAYPTDPTKKITDYTLPDGDFQWLKTNRGNPYDLNSFSNVPWGTSFRNYYSWTLAKACSMRKSDNPCNVKDVKKWYQELSKAIVDIQNSTAKNWPADYTAPSATEGGNELASAFAILALQTQQLNPDQNIYRAFVLRSYSDLHIYDSAGKLHTGINAEGKMECQIPGSKFLIYRKDDPTKKEVKYEDSLNEEGNIGEAYAQEICIWMPNPGKYRIEIVGNSNANKVENPKYGITAETRIDDQIVSTKSYDNIPIKGPDEDGKKDVQATYDLVAIIDGQVPETIEMPDVSAGMEVTPLNQNSIVKVTDQTANFKIAVRETSGVKALHSIKAYCDTFKDVAEKQDILGSTVKFSIPANNTVNAGTTMDIPVTVTIPPGFKGPSTADILVESSEGIAKTVTVTIITNRPPVANAGTDQIAFAGADGTQSALVTLDGSASTDPDADNVLTYEWTENSSIIAVGVKPTVRLSVGEHSISLKVNDGIENSTLDNVLISVTAAQDGKVMLTPVVINRSSHGPWIMSSITLPEGVKKEDVDSGFKAKLFTPSGESIQARIQYVYYTWFYSKGDNNRCFDWSRKSVRIIALYSRTDLAAKLPDDGVYKLTEVCKLKDGKYINGNDYVSIIGKDMKPASLTIKPSILKLNGKDGKIVTYLSVPHDVKRSDININGKITLFTLDGGSVVAESQYISPKEQNKHGSDYSQKMTIIATFDIKKVGNLFSEAGLYEVFETCPLVSGKVIAGFNMIKVFKPTK